MLRVLLTLMLLAIVSGCQRAGEHWPLRELTLPPGASRAPLPQMYAEAERQGTAILSEGQFIGYGKAFNCDSAWLAVSQHVFECLDPLGYKYSPDASRDIAPPGQEPEDYVKVYLSPDQQLAVALINLKACSRFSPGFGGGGDYLVIIMEE